MAELADAPDLGSGGEIRAGSIPVTRTNEKSPNTGDFCVSKQSFSRFFNSKKLPKNRELLAVSLL